MSNAASELAKLLECAVFSGAFDSGSIASPVQVHRGLLSPIVARRCSAAQFNRGVSAMPASGAMEKFRRLFEASTADTLLQARRRNVYAREHLSSHPEGRRHQRNCVHCDDNAVPIRLRKSKRGYCRTARPSSPMSTLRTSASHPRMTPRVVERHFAADDAHYGDLGMSLFVGVCGRR